MHMRFAYAEEMSLRLSRGESAVVASARNVLGVVVTGKVCGVVMGKGGEYAWWRRQVVEGGNAANNVAGCAAEGYGEVAAGWRVEVAKQRKGTPQGVVPTGRSRSIARCQQRNRLHST